MNDPNATSRQGDFGDEAKKFARFEKVVLPRIVTVFMASMLGVFALAVGLWSCSPNPVEDESAAIPTPAGGTRPAATRIAPTSRPRPITRPQPTTAGAGRASPVPATTTTAPAQVDAGQESHPATTVPATVPVALTTSSVPGDGGRGELVIRPVEPPATRPPVEPTRRTVVHRASMPASVSVDDPVLRQMIGIIESCDLPTVLAAYNRASAIAPRSVALNRAFIRRMLTSGRPMIAGDSARQLTQVDEGNPIGWALWGYCCGKKGDPAAALAALVKAMDLGPADPGVQYDIGQLLAWFDAQKPPVSMADETRRIIEEGRGDWAKIGRVVQGYERAAAIIRQQAQEQAEYQRKLASAQQELGNLQQKVNDLTENYWQLLGEIEVHRSNIEYADLGQYVFYSDYLAFIQKENAAITLLKAQAQAVYTNGQTAAAAVRNKQAEIARMKEPAKRTLDQLFLFDPPAVNGVITLESQQPLPASTRPALPVDPEFDARQGVVLARLYMANGMDAKAAAILDDVIAMFPYAKATAEARQLRAGIHGP